MEMKQKVLLAIGIYALSFIFSYNFYQSDIDKYQDALLGKVFLFIPNENDFVIHKQREQQLASILKEKRRSFDDAKNSEQPQYVINQSSFAYLQANNNYKFHINNPPIQYNPPKQRIQELLADAKEKQKSIMINSFAITTAFVAGLLLYIDFKIKRQPK